MNKVLFISFILLATLILSGCMDRVLMIQK